MDWERFRCNIDCTNDPENCIRYLYLPLFYKMFYGSLMIYFYCMIIFCIDHSYSISIITLMTIENRQRAFAYRGAKIWNALNDDLKSLPSVKAFKGHLTKHILNVDNVNS